MQGFDSESRYFDADKLCIDPVISPSTSNYVYESSSNEMSLYYILTGGTQTNFRIKFTSDKPSSKYGHKPICLFKNVII